MLDFIAKGLAKVFGTKSDRDIKELLPKVKEINDIFSGLQKLSDEELRAQTAQIKETINSHLQELDDKIAGFRAEIEALPIDAIHQKDNLFTQIEQVEKERDESLEEVLEKVMPQAFAIVKETARRFKENGQLTVTATLKDKELAATKKNVEIDGDKAIWHNSWLAAGNEVVWDMVHYDVQLIGGMVFFVFNKLMTPQLSWQGRRLQRKRRY